MVMGLFMVTSFWCAHDNQIFNLGDHAPHASIADPEIWSSSFSHDGKLLVAVGGKDKGKGFVKIWQANSLVSSREIKRIDLPVQIHFATLSADDRTIACAGWTSVFVVDLPSGNVIHEVNYKIGIAQILFSPDKKMLVVSYGFGRLDFVNLQERKSEGSLQEDASKLYCVSFNRNGKSLLMANYDDPFSVKEYSFQTRKTTTTAMRSWCDAPLASCFSSDGRLLAVSYPAEYQAELEKLLKDNEGRRESIHDKISAALYRTSYIKVWETASGNEIVLLKKHSGRVWRLCFSRTGRLLVSGSLDGSIRIWELATGKQIAEFSAPKGAMDGLCLSPDENMVAATFSDGTLRVWKLPAKK
jgi:WD40 repeat protein